MTGQRSHNPSDRREVRTLPFPRPTYAAPENLAPNAPLLLVLDADLARTDVTVDLARRKLTVAGVANACRAAEVLLDNLNQSPACQVA